MEQPITPAAVPAHTHTDDLVFQIDFDAAPYLAQATADELRELARNDWGGCETADRVALSLEDEHDGITRMMRYLREIQDLRSKKDQSGFEVVIDAEAALNWVEENRPGVLDTKPMDDNVIVAAAAGAAGGGAC